MREDMETMSRYLFTLALFCSCLACLIPQSRAQGIYKKISPACIEILVGGRLDGSGVIVCPTGLVLTACHVIRKPSKRFEAFSPKVGRKPLLLIATNRGSDMALLKLPAGKAPYPALALAKQIPPEGKPVFLLGSPIFRHHLLIRGSIARKTQTYSWYNGGFTNTIPISAIGAPGSSGGPWVNQKGEIIGLQVATVTTSKGHQGVSSAVPLPSIRRFISEKKNVSVSSIQAAVEELWAQPSQLIRKMPSDAKGLLLRQVAKDGVADKAGLKNEDLILKANGKSYTRIEPFIRMMRSMKPGATLKLEVSSVTGENRRGLSLKTASLD